MNKEVEKIYKRKIKEFQKHNKLYYDKSAPAISDREFDELKAEIINLETGEGYDKVILKMEKK